MKLTIDDVLLWVEKLVHRGIDRCTVNHYIKWGLATAPINRKGGKGVKALYAWQTIVEVATAYYLLNTLGLKKEIVQKMCKKEGAWKEVYDEYYKQFELALKELAVNA